MRALTGVKSVMSAAHRAKDGNMHGHTWEIVCWWDNEPDAVEAQQRLQKYLKVFDHTVLADGLAWGEYLAKSILHGLECVKVEVNRPLEGLFAVVER